jgi:hypothetical protein
MGALRMIRNIKMLLERLFLRFLRSEDQSAFDGRIGRQAPGVQEAGC